MVTEESSLADLLAELQMTEDMPERYTQAELEKIKSLLLMKVDAWRMYLDELESRIARHKQYMGEHRDAMETLQRRLENSEGWLSRLMQDRGFEKLAGQEWQVSLRKSSKVETTMQPGSLDYANIPEFVRRKELFEWDKIAIKGAIERDQFPYEFAKIVQNVSPKFKPKGDK